MASPSSAQAEGGPGAAIAHLPDASEELGRTADLTITVEGAQLKLHSAVAAAGSRVLRTALCACADGDAGSAAAAVQAAFEGYKLEDVQLFLKLLYSPMALDGLARPLPAEGWREVLSLADKLDAPGVMKACDLYLVHSLAAAEPVRSDWSDWLLLADGLQMRRTVAHCAPPVVKALLEASGPERALEQLGRLTSLAQHSSHVLFTVLLKATRRMCASVYLSGGPAAYVVPVADWRDPAAGMQ